MLDTPLSRAPATKERVLHDARAVADAVAPAPVAEARHELVVLRTEPTPQSGSLTFEGVALDITTGRFVDESGMPVSLEAREPTVIAEGSYTVLSGLNEGTGSYSWMSPRQVRLRGIPPDAIYDPFHQPGTVMCLMDSTAQNGPFDEVRLLPEGWHQHVAFAADSPAVPDASLARQWLTDNNDLLFARAAAMLSRAGQLDVRQVRNQAHGYRRAVLHFVSLSSPHTTAHVVSALNADLVDTTEIDHRRAAAIGLLAAQIFAPVPTSEALQGWPAASHPAGLLDPVLVGGDEYIRLAFSLLTPR